MNKRRSLLAGLLLAVLVVAPSPAAAQELTRSVRISLENDFLNLWEPPRERADHNYTHGMRLTWDIARTPRVARRLVCRSTPACGSTIEAGQEIYTSTRDWFWHIEGERPNAGWLYVRGDVRGGDARILRSVGAVVGMTGPASLAEAAQDAVHQAVPRWRPRFGWADQLPNELAFAAMGAQSWHLASRGRSGRFVDAIPSVSATLGTLRTSAAAGARLRAGLPLPHPWLVGPRSRFAPYAYIGLRGEAVWRDLFLDGTLFRRSPRTDHRAVFGEVEGGLALQFGAVALEFRTVRRSRQYDASPRVVTFSALALSWQVGR